MKLVAFEEVKFYPDANVGKWTCSILKIKRNQTRGKLVVFPCEVMAWPISPKREITDRSIVVPSDTPMLLVDLLVGAKMSQLGFHASPEKSIFSICLFGESLLLVNSMEFALVDATAESIK